MTNPKHTDTSRIADLRFQVSEKMPINHSDLSGLFDRIEALEAENERLRKLTCATWFYMPDEGDRCWFSPHEVIDEWNIHP